LDANALDDVLCKAGVVTQLGGGIDSSETLACNEERCGCS
jgi:hypothetical protein